jgi:hypothetical protein
MSGIQIAWAIVATVAGVAVGFAGNHMNGPDFFLARASFTIAALSLGIMTVVWSVRSNEPTWWRITASVLVGLAVFVLFPESLRSLNRRESSRRSAEVPASTAKAIDNSPKTLHDYFLADFNNVLAVEDTRLLRINDDPIPVQVQLRLHLDFNAKAKFVSVYVPNTKWAYIICGNMADGAYRTAFDALKGNKVGGGMAGDTRTVSESELKFTSALFIYHESVLWADQIDEIIAIARHHGLSPVLRGPDYAFARNNPPATPFKIPAAPPSDVQPSTVDHGSVGPTFSEKADQVVVLFGGVEMSYPLSAFKSGVDVPLPLPFGRLVIGKPLRVYVDSGRVFVDMTIGGSHKSPSIEIKHNEFVVTPHGWDRNYSDSALEFVDEQHHPVFQMVYETPYRIRITGVFPFSMGVMIAEPGRTVINPKPPLPPLKKLFKYPSWKYKGIYDETKGVTEK